jgi:hypothetical protein
MAVATAHKPAALLFLLDTSQFAINEEPDGRSRLDAMVRGSTAVVALHLYLTPATHTLRDDLRPRLAAHAFRPHTHPRSIIQRAPLGV